MDQFVTTAFSILIPLTLSTGGWLAGSTRFSELKRLAILRAVSFSIIVSAILLTLDFVFSDGVSAGGLIAVSAVHLTVMLLVVFMAIVLIRFSQRYLHAEPNAHKYWRWLLWSLASVSVVILSNNLLLFWLGWVAISLCFHRLLLFYPDRPRAVLAAHKKFILARLAETLLLTAILLLYWQHGTFQLDKLTHYYLTTGVELGINDKVAAVLIALTALIKCAQLPVHGWLIQVVEAPTPISALLHAGIINLGGFLLISFSPLFSLSPVAKWLIIVVAGISTISSALVMMTRISIKVRLAWSTCAQMGLMLIECALGLYEVALLHLLTHSLYKAYMFLSAGEVIQEYSLNKLAPQKKVTFANAATCFVVALIATTTFVILTSYQGPLSICLLVSTALSLYLVPAVVNGTVRDWLSAVFTVAVLVCLYIAGKTLFAEMLPQLPMTGMFNPMDIWLSLLFVGLYVVTVQIHLFPEARKTQTLYRWLFSGMYLDEAMTRLTLQLWPIQLRPQASFTADNKSIKESWV